MQLPCDYNKLGWRERAGVRSEYVAMQNGKCYHCQGDLRDSPPSEIRNMKINWERFPANFLKYPIHLHHDRKTGMTIGAVHAYCNAVLWQYHGE